MANLYFRNSKNGNGENPIRMVHSYRVKIQKAFVCLHALSPLSTVCFSELKSPFVYSYVHKFNFTKYFLLQIIRKESISLNIDEHSHELVTLNITVTKAEEF